MRRILLVDDEPSILEALEDVLSAEGYEVAVSHNGAQALDVLRRFRPDLILTDLMMPVMDGGALLKRLGASPELSGIRVVVMSAGRTPPPDRRVPFVTKPFELEQLLALLRAQLDGPQQSRQ